MRMHEHFHFRGHLCIVFELLSVSLYELIKGNGFRGFGLATVKRAPPFIDGVRVRLRASLG